MLLPVPRAASLEDGASQTSTLYKPSLWPTSFKVSKITHYRKGKSELPINWLDYYVSANTLLLMIQNDYLLVIYGRRAYYVSSLNISKYLLPHDFLRVRNLKGAELDGSGSKSLMGLQSWCCLGCSRLKAWLRLEDLFPEKVHSHAVGWRTQFFPNF